MVPSIWFSASVVEVVLVVEGIGNDDVSVRDSGVGKVCIFLGQMSNGNWGMADPSISKDLMIIPKAEARPSR
jgi:hypothetical protein